jgi:SIR2-like domain
MALNTDDFAPLRVSPFADHLKKFEEMITQGKRAFLIGAGTSKSAGLPLLEELTQSVFKSARLSVADKAILTALAHNFDGAKNPNIEDYLSELIDLLAIAERRTNRAASMQLINIDGVNYSKTELQGTLLDIKSAIVETLCHEVDIETHREFVRGVHRAIRPGKRGSDQSIDYLVLNYDTLLEDALALEKVPYADGLEGGPTGWWSPSTFDRADIYARIIKLHGSIGWRELPDDPLPRRIPNELVQSIKDCDQVMIWPASTKYRETQRDPYAQLADRARKSLRPSRNKDLVLIISGYSFGDSHINLELDRALRESGGQLAFMAFTSEEKLSGQLLAWNTDPATREQVLIFSRRGFFHGTNHSPSSTDLPWWKFEHLTRLIRGDR